MKKLLLSGIIILFISCQDSNLTRLKQEKAQRDSLRVYFNEYNSEFDRVESICSAYLSDPDKSFKNLERAIIYRDSMVYFRNKSESIYLLMYPKNKNK